VIDAISGVGLLLFGGLLGVRTVQSASSVSAPA
jgi:hypothetical protein